MKTISRRIAILLIAIVSLGITSCNSTNKESKEQLKTKSPKKMEDITLNEQQVGALTMLAQGLSKPPRTPILRTPADMGMQFEEVEFTTEDNVKIKGWFIPANSNKIVISNHFSPGNRYGFAGHLEGMDFAGGFEVNFIPRYKALHDAGYNVLTYDLRSHGESSDGEGKISGVGYFEWQDVLASLKFAENKIKDSEISLISMCMGANATINAMEKSPEAFRDIHSLILVQPLKGLTTIQKQCGNFGIPVEEGVKAFEPIYNKITGLSIEDHNITKRIKHINLPTLYLQVRNDMNSSEEDIQWMYDNTNVEDKDIIWVEGTNWRFKGYTYFSEHPEKMVDWFNKH